MVKATQGQSTGDNKPGVYIPEANLFFVIEPNMNVNEVVEQLGPLSSATIQ